MPKITLKEKKLNEAYIALVNAIINSGLRFYHYADEICVPIPGDDDFLSISLKPDGTWSLE